MLWFVELMFVFVELFVCDEEEIGFGMEDFRFLYIC